MNNSPFYKKYETYFNEYGDRGFFLAWIKFFKAQNVTVLSSSQPIYPLPKEVIEDELLKYLKELSLPSVYIQFLHLYIKNMIIPEKNLSFIKKSDYRLIYWLLFDLNRIQSTNQFKNPPIYTIQNESFYADLINNINNQNNFIAPPLVNKFFNRISKNSFSVNWNTTTPIINFQKYDYQTLITTYDLLEMDIKSKLNMIQNSFNAFKNFKTPDNEISWINPNEIKQIEWSINYLKKLNLYIPSFFEYSDINQYEQILITLDSTHPHYPLQRTVFIEKMKKSWTQQKYREAGKVKTNYHLPLTKDCKEKLKKLSALMNMNENKLLEKLINEKYDLEATDDNGKFKF